MYIERKIEKVLLAMVKCWPVVTVVGTRQSGKTTLVRHALPDYAYANLEDRETRNMALKDPKKFFEEHKAPAIIDEIQLVPELLSYIQVMTDESGLLGQYVLTGSHQPLLKGKVVQSLAGRTGILTVHPLSIEELCGAGIELPTEELLYKGFMPRIHAGGSIPAVELYEDYYSTYVERDVRQLINLKLQNQFELFVKLLAGRTGQLVNYESLSNDVGVNSQTIREWLSILEASYVIMPLRPYFKNFGKRLVKHSKIYFTEVGLAARLLGICGAKEMKSHPLFGQLFENMVVMDVFKWRASRRNYSQWHFLRDSSGLEIDLVSEEAMKLHLFEIKAAFTPNQDMGRGISTCGQVKEVISSTIFYQGENCPLAGGGEFINYKEVAKRLDSLLLRED